MDAHVVSCARRSCGGDEFPNSDVCKQIVCHSGPRLWGVTSLCIDTTLSRLYSIRIKEEESCMHEQGCVVVSLQNLVALKCCAHHFKTGLHSPPYHLTVHRSW